jgi:hypothetical protein
MRKIYNFGFKEYFYSWSNMLSSVIIILFSASYVINYYTLVKLLGCIDSLSNVDFWHKVANLTANDTQGQIDVYKTFYWLNSGMIYQFNLKKINFFLILILSSLDRFYWVSLDPINLSEGLFGIGILLSFANLTFWLPANQTFGPLQITLGAMINVILYFVFTFHQ